MAELAALQEKVRLCAPCAWHQHALTRSRNVQLDAERAKTLELTAELNRLRKEKGADPVRCRAGRRPLARSHPLHALSQGATASRRSSWPAAPERTRTRSISRWWTRSWRAVRPALWISRRCSLILRTRSIPLPAVAALKVEKNAVATAVRALKTFYAHCSRQCRARFRLPRGCACHVWSLTATLAQCEVEEV